MPGHLICQAHPASQPRWTCINSIKNSPVTIALHCSWDDKRFVLPSQPPNENVSVNYYDEQSDDVLLGSTTLYEVIKKVKAQIPALYMWEEVGGLVLTCGPNHIFASEWETTMLCRLIHASDGEIPVESLEDGREAIVVTIGAAQAVKSAKASVVTRCLAKGHVYG